MNATTDTRNASPASYLDLFARRGERAAESERLRRLRREAIERFEATGFPARGNEEWRQTNVGPLVRATPIPAQPQAIAVAEAEPFFYPGTDRLVFVNGRYAPALSSPPEQVTATAIAGLPASGGASGRAAEVVAEHLGTAVDGSASCSADAGIHPFAALNTGLFEDGAVIEIGRGAVVERPLHVLWLSVPGSGAAGGESVEVSFPRLLVVAGENSQGSVIETFASVGTGAAPCFVCPAAEFSCAPGSVLHHTRMQVEALDAFHLAFQHARVDRAACFDSSSLTFGGGLVRNDTVALLDGEGADCTLDGLYIVAGSQFVDNHMRVEHRQPHGTSHQLYKGVLNDRARSVFNGRIYVHREAQKTDAKQTNRNLLLSDSALANSNPQLEIFADDVRCTHGSTIGRLDEDALFYLRARGIPRDEAHGMLVYAFARELVEKTSFEPLRRDLEGRLFAGLVGGAANGSGNGHAPRGQDDHGTGARKGARGNTPRGQDDHATGARKGDHRHGA